MKEQTELTLNQQLQQSENAYKNAQQAFKFAQTSSENAVKQAYLGLSGAENQLEGLKNSFSPQKLTLLNLMQNVLEKADALLGVTNYYEDQFKGHEIYLGAKDQAQKSQAEEKLKHLYTLKENIDKLPGYLEEGSGLSFATQTLKRGYEETINFTVLMQEVIRNSIPSEGSFGEKERNAQLQIFQNLQS